MAEASIAYNKFDTAKVIEACEACIVSIDQIRNEARQRLIEQYRTYRKYWFGPVLTRTDEEALAQATIYDDLYWTWQYGSYKTRDLACEILQVASLTESEQVHLTRKELNCIINYWPFENSENKVICG